jgi:hypothetical protein
MGHQVVDQLLRLMLFSKLFNFNVSTSGIWQLENIWLEIGKTMLQGIGSLTENVGTIDQIDSLTMEYVNKIAIITKDMKNFKISITQIVQYIKFIANESPIVVAEAKQSILFKEETDKLIESYKNPNPFKKV